MKNFKTAKGLAALTAAVMMCSASAFAKEEAKNIVAVNGGVLENAHYTMNDGKVMIPLRAVCEALGFEVNWDGEAERIELVKLPVYITCSPYSDGYTFAKTAPMMLGTAPVMIDDTTYVPTNFVTEILEGQCDVSDGDVIISYGEEAQDGAVVSVYIKEKTENGFLVESFESGEMIITVSDETIITDENGNVISLDSLDASNQLKVKLSDAMTLSLPPVANALEIVRTQELAKTVIEGKITEVVKEDGKLVQVVLDDNRVALNLDESTVVNDMRAESADNAELAEGMYIKAQTTGVSTRSIPPQYPTNAVNIIK